jgi:hypothetical protein
MAHLSREDGITSDDGVGLLFFLEGVAVDGPGGPGGLLYAKRVEPVSRRCLAAETRRSWDAGR